MRKTVNTTDALISVFRSTQNYFGRPYSYLSIETMRKRLKSLHRIDITYAGVRKQLVKLKTLGLLKTFPMRFERNADGTIYAIPPNRSLTVGGFRRAMALGAPVLKSLWDHVRGKKKMPRVTAKDIAQRRPADYVFSDKDMVRVADLLQPIGESFT